MPSAGAGIEIVQFNPKIVVYDVLRPVRDHRQDRLLRRGRPTPRVNAAALPWSITIVTTLPACQANIMAQGDSDHFGVVSSWTARSGMRKAPEFQPHIFCLVKSA